MMGPLILIILRLHDDTDRVGIFSASTYGGTLLVSEYQIFSHCLINSPAPSPLGVHILLGFLSEPPSEGVMDAGVGRSLQDPLHYRLLSMCRVIPGKGVGIMAKTCLVPVLPPLLKSVGTSSYLLSLPASIY